MLFTRSLCRLMGCSALTSRAMFDKLVLGLLSIALLGIAQGNWSSHAQRVAAQSASTAEPTGAKASQFPEATVEAPLEGIGPVGPVAKLHDGFRFTEGPAADRQGNVYFTDIPSHRILIAGVDGKLATFLEESQACNGLMFDTNGQLFACQGRTHSIVRIDPTTKAITPLVDKHGELPLIRPNDLALDGTGGIYFTDLSSLSDPPHPNTPAIYYLSATGQLTRLLDDLARPNGVLLSPDEKTLYAVPSGTPVVMAYPILEPGKLGPGKVLAEFVVSDNAPPRGGDGLAVDVAGNLYLANPAVSAIQVVSPEGKTLGLIRFPEKPANCVFGGPDFKTLYVTAHTGLYAVPLQIAGHQLSNQPAK